MPESISIANELLLEALTNALAVHKETTLRDLDAAIAGQEDRKRNGTLQDKAQAQAVIVTLRQLRTKTEEKTIEEYVHTVLVNAIRKERSLSLESDPVVKEAENAYTEAVSFKDQEAKEEHDELTRELEL